VIKQLPKDRKDPDLWVKAKEMYNTCTTVKPLWDDLHDVTREVWYDKAEAVCNPQ
jgi:hypothetical protein